LALWALSAGIDRSGIRIGSAMMSLALLLQWRDLWPRIRRDPIFWAGLALLLYLIVDAWRGVQLYPATVVAQRHAVGDVAVFTMLSVLPVAWWMGGNTRRIGWILALALAGLTIGILLDFNWADPRGYLHGERLVAMRSPNGLGLYSATAVLGLAIFGIRFIFSSEKAGSSRLRYPLTIVWIIATATYTVVHILAQSRSAWLAAAIIILPTVALYVYHLIRSGVQQGASVPWRPLVMTFVCAIVAGSIAIYASFGAIEKRIVSASDEVAVSHVSETDEISDLAVRTRLELWKFGLDRFAEHPILGIGPGSARHLISTESPPIIQRYRHFHNLYLHLLVTAGLVGATLVFTIGALVALAAWRTMRAGTMPVEIGYFVGGAALLYLVVSFFTIRHDDTYGRTFLLLLGGIAYTFWLHRDVVSETKAVQSPSGPVLSNS